MTFHHEAAPPWLKPLFALVIVSGCVSLAAPSTAVAQELATDWVAGHNVKSRLVGGRAAKSGATELLGVGNDLVAGLEIEMSAGWKTYWRNPGDAGGVPPDFDWSGSTNLASATVLYPAPKRLTDRAGSTIGYKGHVAFPVVIKAKDPTQPVLVKLVLAFGVCHDICVPSEGEYTLTLPPNARGLPEAVAAALEKVPVPAAANTLPRIVKVSATLDGTNPKIDLDVAFGENAGAGDVFVEGPEGEYVPMTVAKDGDARSVRHYTIDLTMGADVDALKGNVLRATLVSGSGQSEQSFKLE